MAKIAVYRRVSLERQDMASQDFAIQQWLAARSGDLVTVFEDHGISGKTLKRPGLQAMIAAIETGAIDTVVTFRLDRISRNAVTALTLLLDWAARNISLVFVDQRILDATVGDPFRLTKLAMFSELAQVEREVTVSRVRAGLAAARARGVKLGAAPKLTSAQIQQARSWKQQGLGSREIGRRLSVAATTVSRAIRKERVCET